MLGPHFLSPTEGDAEQRFGNTNVEDLLGLLPRETESLPMTLLRAGLFLFVVLGVAGCSDPKPPAPSPSPSKPAVSAPAAKPATVTAQEALSAAAVATLLSRWTDAQNNGDFAAYEGLYASRFTGWKRVGERESRFDRAGWVTDRKRMFGKAMKVVVSEVETTLQGNTAVVRFTQRWSQDKFADVGPKQLVVVSEGGAAKITREEMLSSTVATPGKAKALAAGELAFVVTVGDTTQLLLEPTEAATEGPVLEWSESVREYPYHLAATKALTADAPTRAKWVGKPVRLYGSNGGCGGNIADVRVTRMHRPHFGVKSEWDAEGTGAEARRDFAWSAGADGQFLVATLDVSGCKVDGLLWAQVGTRARDALRSMYPAEFEGAARMALLESTDVHAKLYTGDHEDGDAAYATAGDTRVAVWGHDKAPEFVTVSGHWGDCADWMGAAGLFAVADGVLKPVSLEVPSDFETLAMADVNGDGTYELIGTRSGQPAYAQLVDGHWYTRNLGVPDYDCPC